MTIVDGWVYGTGIKRTVKIGRKSFNGKWGDAPRIPSHNWIEDHIGDNEDKTDICGMCEYMDIRYLHFMRHPDFTEFEGEPVLGIVAGRHCAPDMMSNGTVDDIREKRAMVKRQEDNLDRKKRRQLKKEQAHAKTTPRPGFSANIRSPTGAVGGSSGFDHTDQPHH